MVKNFITPLKDLCNNFKEDIVDGPFGANLKREHYQLDGIPVLKIQNIKPFRITLKKMDFVTEEKYLELKRHSYSEGDIIMTKLGNPLGESAIVEGVDNGLIVADLVRIRAQKIDTRYLCYHLNSPLTIAYINSQQKGTTRPRVRISVVRDLPIYTPPLAEQKRIVALLDTVFADLEQTRAKTEQNLKSARELFDSYLQQVFSQKGEGWVEKSISKLGLVQTGNTPKTSTKENFGNFISFVKPGHFLDGGHIDFANSGLSEQGKEQSRLIPKNSVLMVCIGATIGKCGFVQKEITCNQQINTLTPSNDIDYRFAYYQMLTNSFQQKVIYLSGQATLPIINKSKWSSLKLSYPAKDIQLVIINKLDSLKVQTQELETNYKNKISTINELKKSILQKAFSGELTRKTK
jgi:type I restriction enzyme S subunit